MSLKNGTNYMMSNLNTIKELKKLGAKKVEVKEGDATIIVEFETEYKQETIDVNSKTYNEELDRDLQPLLNGVDYITELESNIEEEK